VANFGYRHAGLADSLHPYGDVPLGVVVDRLMFLIVDVVAIL
jgi:hypothetical protein